MCTICVRLFFPLCSAILSIYFCLSIFVLFTILIINILSLCICFIFSLQNFLAANSQCWWNGPLTAATRALKYAGHVAPGMLLVTAEPCALEVLRGAYARSVLKPPATYVISAVGKSQNTHTQNYKKSPEKKFRKQNNNYLIPSHRFASNKWRRHFNLRPISSWEKFLVGSWK